MKKSTKLLWKNMCEAYEDSADILGPLWAKVAKQSMEVFEHNVIFFLEPASQTLARLRDYTEPL